MDHVTISVGVSPPVITLGIEKQNMIMMLIHGGADTELYTGEYTVIPKPDEEQTLQTKNKLLADNIKVTRIPFYAVSNPQNGKTATIGVPLIIE